MDGIGAVSASQVFQNGLTYIAGMGNSENEKVSQTQIENVANQFEAVFASLLLKQMRNTIDEGGLFGGEQSDSFGAVFDMYLGEHIGQSRNLGIGDAVEAYLSGSKV